MWRRWIPWRYLISRMARAQGFLDPVKVLAQVQRFAQPSEVAAPLELLRLSATLQARGILNSQAIQHNLDWIWPYWVFKQFDPHDRAFIPRAFSVTHINLSHRNWTAVGVPGCTEYPIVDPRGLVTPLFDGWSLDCWFIPDEGTPFFPSREARIQQTLEKEGNLAVLTACRREGFSWSHRTEMVIEDSEPVCQITCSVESAAPGWLVLSVRPFNPEGVSLIDSIQSAEDLRGWTINGSDTVRLGKTWDRMLVSQYQQGDVFHRLMSSEDKHENVRCAVGMASAAALWEVTAGEKYQIQAWVPVSSQKKKRRKKSLNIRRGQSEVLWRKALREAAPCRVPDAKFQFLYDASLRSLILHSSKDVFPGPYTYRHFWFRDAVFALSGLLACGLVRQAGQVLDLFAKRQQPSGYFRSQDGEWDSNGQVLWAFCQYVRQTWHSPKPAWMEAIRKGARWLIRKRSSRHAGTRHDGLLPAGFSAEHLGPNDFYYWDNMWGIAGLQSAAWLAYHHGHRRDADAWQQAAQDFQKTVDENLKQTAAILGTPAMPASPYRRLDSGSIGSLAADYPTRLWPPRDPRILATAEYLYSRYRVHGGFFHELSHSGINPYLSLHIAQVFLRAGDPRYWDIMTSIARLASPTGQWPEAIHPQTLGGCMGDGQHVWASTEWLLMMRHLFVREEEEGLILGAGIPGAWLHEGSELIWGPAPTIFGSLEVRITQTKDAACRVAWQAVWHSEPPQIEIRVPGFRPVVAQAGETAVSLQKEIAT